MRIVYLTDGMASSVNASLELSRRLTEAGHEVVYLSPVDVGETVAGAGYAFRLLDGDRQLVDASPPVGWVGLVRPIEWIGAINDRRRLKRRSIENDEIPVTVAELEPDVLLIDFEMHYAIFATANLRIPTLLTTVFFSVFRRPGLVPLDSTTSPDSASRRRQELEWLHHRTNTHLLEWRQRLLRTAQADWFRPARYNSMDVDTLREVARHNGVDPSIVGRSDWQRPFTHPTIPMLSFNLFELELPHQPSPVMHYVGPMVRPPSSHAAGSDEWHRFQRDRLAERPLVYCSLGTYWATDHEFLRRVIGVFAERTEWDLVIGLGGAGDPDRLGPLPENVLALHTAPQTAILPFSAACITHGGATTLAECTAAAVPVLVYSTGHVDQNGNATRVDHHRTGALGSRNDTSARMGERLSTLMTDDELKHRLQTLRTRVGEVYDDAVEIITAAAQ